MVGLVERHGTMPYNVITRQMADKTIFLIFHWLLAPQTQLVYLLQSIIIRDNSLPLFYGKRPTLRMRTGWNDTWVLGRKITCIDKCEKKSLILRSYIPIEGGDPGNLPIFFSKLSPTRPCNMEFYDTNKKTLLLPTSTPLTFFFSNRLEKRKQ